MSLTQPLHPGAIVQQYMGDSLTVSGLAAHLGMTRTQISRIINARAGISAAMALKLAEAFETSPQLWINLQSSYDLARARKERARQPKISAIRTLRTRTKSSA